MALLDELFPGGNPGGPMPSLDDPEVMRLLRERIMQMGAGTASPSGPTDPGNSLNIPTRGIEDILHLMQHPPPQTEVMSPAARGIPQSPPQEPSAPVVPPPRVVTPAPRAAPPSEEINPLERLGALLAGAGDRGQGVIARIGGMLSAGPAFDRTRRAENQTVQALMQADPAMTPEQAQTISRNPQAVGAFFGPRAGPTFGIIGEDQFGAKRYGWIDPRTRTTTPANVTGQPTAEPAAGPELSGQAFLDTLPADIRSQVQGIAEGRVPYPTGQFSRTPAGRRLMAAINQYDPTFTAQTYQERLRLRQDFASGRSAQNIRSLNTVMGHLDSLDQAIAPLGNFERLPMLNIPLNAIRGQVSTDYQAARRNFEVSRDAVATELMRVFRETSGSVTEVRAWMDQINAADSPVALRRAVRQATDLIASRLSAVNDTWNRVMGGNRDPREIMSPSARAVFDRLNSPEGTPPATPPPGPGETPPAGTGQIPAVPTGVPADAQWSPSRRQWRAPNGTTFDERGRRLGTR